MLISPTDVNHVRLSIIGVMLACAIVFKYGGRYLISRGAVVEGLIKGAIYLVLFAAGAFAWGSLDELERTSDRLVCVVGPGPGNDLAPMARPHYLFGEAALKLKDGTELKLRREKGKGYLVNDTARPVQVHVFADNHDRPAIVQPHQVLAEASFSCRHDLEYAAPTTTAAP